MTWFVVRSATRREKTALASLAELRVPAYCPMETRWVTHARTKTAQTYPLFPGYLFADITEQDVYPVLNADGIHNIIGLQRTKATFDPGIVIDLREAEAAGAFDRTLGDPKPKTSKDFKPGTGARVTSGQYAGFVGQVIEARGKGRLLLLVNLFGRPQKIERPVSELEAA